MFTNYFFTSIGSTNNYIKRTGIWIIIGITIAIVYSSFLLLESSNLEQIENDNCKLPINAHVEKIDEFISNNCKIDLADYKEYFTNCKATEKQCFLALFPPHKQEKLSELIVTLYVPDDSDIILLDDGSQYNAAVTGDTAETVCRFLDITCPVDPKFRAKYDFTEQNGRFSYYINDEHYSFKITNGDTILVYSTYVNGWVTLNEYNHYETDYEDDFEIDYTENFEDNFGSAP